VVESATTFEMDSVTLSFPGVCRIQVAGRQHIQLEGEDGVSEEALSHFALGVGMGALLHQREVLALHASAVVGPFGALLFMGSSSLGKSTLAAAFHENWGWPLVADDISAIEFHGDGAYVAPAYPYLRLWPEAAESLGLATASVPIFPGAEKRRIEAFDGFPSEPVRIAGVYVLQEAARTAIHRMRPHDAIAELVVHSFAARLLEKSGPQEWHFNASSQLARQVPIRYLASMRTSLASLDPAMRVIEADL